MCEYIYIYIYIHFLLKFEKRAFHSPFLICVITLSGHGLRVLRGPSGKLVCIFLNALVSLLVHCPRLDVLSVWLSDLTATLSIIKRYDMSTVCYQHVSVTHSEDEHFGTRPPFILHHEDMSAELGLLPCLWLMNLSPKVLLISVIKSL